MIMDGVLGIGYWVLGTGYSGLEIKIFSPTPPTPPYSLLPTPYSLLSYN